MAKEGVYKIHIDLDTYIDLIHTLNKHDPELAARIEEHTKRPGASVNHHRALLRIAEDKREKTEEKIKNAVRLLLFEGKEPTVYRVAKTAGISYNTAKKYAREIEFYARTVSTRSME